MEQYRVIFYEREDGSHPAYDFISTLSKKMQAKRFGATYERRDAQ